MRRSKYIGLTISLVALALTAACTKKEASQTTMEQHEHKDGYTCAMHPQVKSDKPGKCPICHMDLIPIKSAEAAEAIPSSAQKKERKVKFYRNPMNPAITSPTFIKDEMGMDYIPVYEETKTESVYGRASFEVDSLQATNLQVKPFAVHAAPLTEKLRVSARIAYGSGLALQILEADADKIKSGQTISFTSPGSTKDYKGKITSVDSGLDPMSRTVRATASLTNAQGLRSESSGVATVEINLGQGLLLPEDAVIRTGENDIVYLIQGKKLVPTKVRLGVKLAGAYQILEGIKEGDEVSSSANFLIDSEARIRGIHD